MEERRIRASIAMAVYNGEKYLREQVDSVLSSMGNDDELVISYDRSSDNSLAMISDYAKKDNRVRVVINQANNAGIAGNFSNAIANCKGEYIFLCDQDDYWLENKIERILKEFKQTQANLVIHDGLVVDEGLKPLNRTLLTGVRITTSPVANFIRGRFWGCCMAFDSDAISYVAPFPRKKRSIPHDIFASIMVGIKGKTVVIDDVLIYHRLHQRNETPTRRRPLAAIIPDRISLLTSVIARLIGLK